MKKIISILLVSIILFGTFSGLSFAADSTKIIEKNGVYQIGDLAKPGDGFVVLFPNDLQTSNKTYPVAVWANGTKCSPSLYTSLLIAVAKEGYIVVACGDTMAKDGKSQSKEIDYIFAENANKNSVFYQKVDTSRVGAFGQSQGGASCVNCANSDSRVGAIVSIAGASTAEEASLLTVPTLFLTGTSDYIVLASSWVEPSFEACNAPCAYASLKNGVHTSFLLCPQTYADYTVKWFNAWLYEDGSKSAFKYGGELDKDSNWTDFRAKNYNCNVGIHYVDATFNFFVNMFSKIFSLFTMQF